MREYIVFDFFGSENEPNLVIISRTQNMATSLPHIVELPNRDTDSSAVALRIRTAYCFQRAVSRSPR